MTDSQQGLLLNDEDIEKPTDSPMVDWLDQHTRQRVFYIRKIASLLTTTHLINLFKRVLYYFVPQLLRSHFWDDHASSEKEFPTSYLNGLRGMTAVKVFTFHYFMVFTDATHEPYGTDDRHTYFIQLPLIRYFYSGFTSHIFFALAGYLTSLRLFQLLDKNEVASQAKVLMSVSGSLFRRAFRLYLPVFLITLLMATYIHLGFYESNRPLLLDHQKLFPGDWNETKPLMYPTWQGQLQAWAAETYDLTNLISPQTVYPFHDQHLWSILAEMRASLHLYGCLIALAQVKRSVRLILLCVLVGVYFYWNHWEIWVYLLGAVVAQLDQILSENEQDATRLPLNNSTTDPEKVTPMWVKGTDRIGSSLTTSKTLRATGFLIAFYLLSYPIHGSRDYAPGYETLNKFIPSWMERKDKFYANIGAFIFLVLLVRSDAKMSRWRSLCSHHIPQYLGKISFAFYLVQAIIMHAFGYMIPHHVWWSMGTEGVQTSAFIWLFGIMIGYAVTLACTLWMADCWTREVEGRCIKFVKWLEAVCFRQ